MADSPAALHSPSSREFCPAPAVNLDLPVDEFWGFHDYDRAYYAQSLRSVREDETLPIVQVGLYCRDGGTLGEFRCSWKRLGSELAPLLEVYGDAMGLMARCPDFFKALGAFAADEDSFSPPQFMQFLTEAGLYDITSETPGEGEAACADRARRQQEQFRIRSDEFDQIAASCAPATAPRRRGP